MSARNAILGLIVGVSVISSSVVRADDNDIKRFEKRLRISALSDHVIYGAAPSRTDIAFLARTRGVNRIICLLAASPKVDEEKAAAKALGVAFEHRPLAIGLDGPLDKARIDRTVARSIVDDLKSITDGATYVHCQSGRDRAGFIRFAHRILIDEWSFAAALKESLELGFASAKLPGFFLDMKLLASGLDELPKLKSMPIAGDDLNARATNANIGAQTLNVKIMGEGPPLYVIHGGPGESHKMFRPYLDAFAKTHTLVYYDQVGCGGSSKPQFAEAYTLERQTKELDLLRSVAKHEKISMIAQSSGCLIAIKYALMFPDRVDKMVLLAGWANGEEFRANLQLLGAVMQPPDRAGFDLVMGKLRKSMRRPNDRELVGLVGLQVPGMFFGEVDYAFRKDWQRHIEVSSFVNAAMEKEVFKDLDIRSDLAKIKNIPTLVIAGKFDLITPPSVVQSLAEGIKGSRFEVFQRSGHFPMVEENERFIEMVSSFLASGE
ncbi:MAG: alpha/beta fold hydrolase [Planctomycetes bacterium]|nr:alpha/beta fold hydrolase [Planctomycetota bacterium]